MVVTRVNTNCNGPLHLGHLYTAKINEAFAHERGGHFVWRFEDTCQSARLIAGERLPVIREQQRADIEWLGLQVDEWCQQSDMLAQAHRSWQEHGYEPFLVDEVNPPCPVFVGEQEQGFVSYPWTPLLTAERVWLDRMNRVTHVIRGKDLVTEYSLYCQLCMTFGLPIPVHVYLPRLYGSRGNISKTAGGHTIAELRADGWTPEQIHDMIAKAALITPANGWHLNNLKAEPRVSP